MMRSTLLTHSHTHTHTHTHIYALTLTQSLTLSPFLPSPLVSCPADPDKQGKKGKKDKDMTSDRTVESLYDELIKAGIAKKVAPVSMQDYCGQYR